MGNSSSTEVVHIRNAQLAKEWKNLMNEREHNIVLVNMLSQYPNCPKKKWVIHKLSEQIYVINQELALLSEEHKCINNNDLCPNMQKAVADHIRSNNNGSGNPLISSDDIQWNRNVVKDWYVNNRAHPSMDEIYAALASFDTKHSVYRSMYPEQDDINKSLRSFNDGNGNERFEGNRKNIRKVLDYYPPASAIKTQLKSFPSLEHASTLSARTPMIPIVDVKRQLQSFR